MALVAIGQSMMCTYRRSSSSSRVLLSFSSFSSFPGTLLPLPRELDVAVGKGDAVRNRYAAYKSIMQIRCIAFTQQAD